MITQSQAKDLFIYSDGDLLWQRKPAKNIYALTVAGNVSDQGYIIVAIEGERYRAHRIIFLMHHGYLPDFLDHIDGNRQNNKIENLRECTKSQNQCNAKISTNNTSGIKCVSWNKKMKGWRVVITFKGKEKYCGTFWDIYTADLTAKRERIKMHAEFTNHG